MAIILTKYLRNFIVYAYTQANEGLGIYISSIYRVPVIIKVHELINKMGIDRCAVEIRYTDGNCSDQ